jgi:hypothetical protein
MNGIQFGGQMCLAMFTRRRRGTGIEVFGADIGGAACLRGRPASWQRANDLVTLPLERCRACLVSDSI